MAGYIGNKAAFLSSTSGADIDGNVTIDGDLTVSGNTVTIDSAQAQEIRLGDNDKMTFGDATGGDLQIYHDGNNSFVSDQGVGNLKLQGQAKILLEDATSTDTYAEFNRLGDVKLYYNGSSKLATTSTGIDVTGTVTADGLTVDATTTVIQKTGDNPTLQFKGHAGTQDTIGEIQSGRAEFSGTNSFMRFKTNDGTSTKSRLNIDDNGDISFYEDTGTTAKFFWDASAESLGIGTTSAGSKLTIDGDGSGEVFKAQNTSGSATMRLVSSNTGVNYFNFQDTDGVGGQFLYSHTNNYLAVKTNNSEAMRIDSSGNVGIGASSPLTKLHVKSEGTGNSYGSVYLEVDTATNYPAMVIQTATGGNYSETHGLYIKNTAAGYGLRIDDASGDTTPFVVDTEGRVGVGISTPNQKLTVRDANVIIDAQSSADSQIVGFRAGYQSHATLAGFFKYSTGDAQLYIDNTFQGNNGVYSDINFRNCPNGSTSLTPRMKIKGSTGNVGINTTSPGAKLHVEGDFLIGQQRFREGYTGINSSETRWYKIMNYATGNMFSGRIFITANRFGGYNQTGAYREYKASIGGYSNAIYGPLNTTGDTGEGGVGSIEFGTDEAMYLRVNASVYGGTLYFYLQGYISNWQFDNTSYSTSLP